MKELKIIKHPDHNFSHEGYENSLNDIISIYKSQITDKFPWVEELFIELLIKNFIPSSGVFNPNKEAKTLGILIIFHEIPTMPEFNKTIKNTFKGGLNQIYP